MASLTHIALDRIFAAVTTGGFSVVWPDGQAVNYGPDAPEFTLTINDHRAIGRMVKNMSLGFAESYMDGLIDIDGDLHDVVALANRNAAAFPGVRKPTLFKLIRGVTLGSTPEHARRHVAHHYDIGNEFYELWLDETLTYSCAYFIHERDALAQAQRQKIAYTLRKLQLRKGMHLLDIGSGWGELILTAAKEYGVHARGVTHSREQLAKTKARIKREELTRLVDVELKDYRHIAGENVYDRIVSVGMFEHVGRPHHNEYFATVNRLLKPGGLSLLHTITKLLETGTDAFIGKHIFPGGYIPSWREVIKHLPEHDFHLVDAESLRLHYALTLDAWAKNFEAHVDQVRAMFDERFVRMWRLYLRACAASFRTSGLDLHQFVFAKGLNNELPLTRAHLYT